MKPLTPKQQRFVREYLIDLNASAAYRRAGYTSGSPHVHGPRLVANDRIQAALQVALAERSKRTEITADKVLEELAKIGFADTTAAIYVENGSVKVRDTNELTPALRCAIAEIRETTTKEGGTLGIKFHDKKGALELLGRHLGLFPSKVEMTGKDGKDLFSPAQLLRAAEEIKAKGGR